MKQLFERGYRAFERASLNAVEVQEALLMRILRDNGDTTYGLLHNFKDIRSVEHYQREVPLVSYEDIETHIQSMGDKDDVLTRGVTNFVPTSGSKGGRKLIPYNREQFAAFRNALEPWLYDLIETHGIDEMLWYWSISPFQGLTRHGSKAVGLENDLAYFTPAQQHAIQKRLLIPEVQQDGFFEGLKTALEKAQPEFVSIWSPTFLLLANADFSPELISSWGDASAQQSFRSLQERYTGSAFQKKGLLATEAVVTFPFKGHHVLAVTSHFFEFKSGSNVVCLDDLEQNTAYEVIITNSAGLYRYRTGDVVMLVGRYNSVPVLEFQGRHHTSDLVGEKISELDAKRAISCLAGMSFLTPNPEALTYRVFSTESERYKARVEEALRENPYYADARDKGQLGNLEWIRIPPESMHRVVALNTEARIGDVKPPLLETYAWGVAFLRGENA